MFKPFRLYVLTSMIQLNNLTRKLVWLKLQETRIVCQCPLITETYFEIHLSIFKYLFQFYEIIDHANIGYFILFIFQCTWKMLMVTILWLLHTICLDNIISWLLSLTLTLIARVYFSLKQGLTIWTFRNWRLSRTIWNAGFIVIQESSSISHRWSLSKWLPYIDTYCLPLSQIWF